MKIAKGFHRIKSTVKAFCLLSSKSYLFLFFKSSATPSGKSPARLIMTCIMGAAAGIVLFFGIWTAVETFRRPEDTFTDPETAYAEVEKALFSISEKMNAGLEKAAEAEKTLDRSMETVKSLYLNKYNELQ